MVAAVLAADCLWVPAVFEYSSFCSFAAADSGKLDFSVAP